LKTCAFFNSKKVMSVDALLAMIAMVGAELSKLEEANLIAQILGMFTQDLLTARVALVNAEVPVLEDCPSNPPPVAQ